MVRVNVRNAKVATLSLESINSANNKKLMSEAIVCSRCVYQPGDVINSSFKVDVMLGEGTYGCVYRVHDNEGNTYALKLLKLWEVVAQERSELLKRFDLEYETGQIESKYLVRSIGRGMVGGNPFILMEFCSGGDLMKAAEKGYADFYVASREILLGLKALHQRGKVHRDLKPENVLFKQDGTAVLTDFGISGDQNKRLTQRGILGVPQQRFGTFAYMPPEQVNPKRGNATVLPTTDIFSFGVMMYQLITGELPFGNLEEESDLPQYINHGKAGVWNREILHNNAESAKWERMIEGCLVPDYHNRLQSVDDVLSLVPESSHAKAISFNVESLDFQRVAVRGYMLHIMEGENHGMKYYLDDLARNLGRLMLTIGRESNDTFNVISLKETLSTYISRCHATLEFNQRTHTWILRDGQWRLACEIARNSMDTYPCRLCKQVCMDASRRRGEWLRSLNGTFVGSKEIDADGVELNIGDIITIGDVKMRIEGY